MSIIYTALQRLDAAEPALAGGIPRDRLPQLGDGSGNKMVAAVTLVALVALTASALAFLQRDGTWDHGQFSGTAPPSGSIVANSNYVDLPLPSLGSDHYTGRIETVDSVSPVEEPGEWDADQDASAPSTTPASADERAAVAAILAPLPGYSAAPDAVPAVATELEADLAAVEIDIPPPTLVAPEPWPVVATYTTAPDASADGTIDQARRALSRGNYLESLTALEEIQPVPGERADFWLVKGSAHLAIGQLDLAESAFREARRLMPDNAQIIVQQAILAQERGDHVAALGILEDASAHHPEVPEIFLNMGYSQQALGALPEARRSFSTFLKMTERRSLYLQQREVVRDWLAQEAPAGA